MTEVIKDKKTRTPRNLQSIQVGALALPLQDRVALCKALKESVDTEVKSLQEQANAAGTLLSGLNGATVK